jgi:hypothetical protein
VVFVLEEMKKLDQQIATPRLLAEQGADLIERLLIDLPPLRLLPATPPAGAWMDTP